MGAEPLMRRHPCFVAVLLLLAKMEAVWACSVGRPSPVEELYASASTVFVGRLVRVEEAGEVGTGELPPPKPTVEGAFEVVEVFKGKPPTDGKIRAPAPAACPGPILLVAFDYVFFLSEGNFIRSWDDAMPVYDTPPNPTGERKRLLDKLRNLSENEQPK